MPTETQFSPVIEGAPAVMESSLAEAAGINSVQVARKATRGAAALAIRQVLVYGSNIGGSVLLARILPPTEFGYYAMVVFAVNFLTIFGGTGFASSLIRTPEEPTLHEKQAVFTYQELIITVIVVVLWFVSPVLAHGYHLAAHGSTFFRLMGVSLVLTSLMVIPQVQMERELNFDQLAIIEASQAVLFNVIAVVLALRGFGYISFALALVARTACGALLALVLSPWRPGLRLSAEGLKQHLHFGFSLQASQLLVVSRDSLTPVFIGLFLGVADVGYITWAWLITAYPVLIIFPLQRLYLPLFAKVQSDMVELRRFVAGTLWTVNAISAPLTLITLGLLHPIVTIIFGAKWLYALPLVYYLSSANLFIPSASPIIAVLNALGRSRTTLAFTAVSTIVTWTLGVVFTMKWGIWGFGYATVGCCLPNFMLYWYAWKDIGVNPFKGYWPSWPLACVAGVLANIAYHLRPPHNIFDLVFYGVVALGVYLLGICLISSRNLRALAAMVRQKSNPEVSVEIPRPV